MALKAEIRRRLKEVAIPVLGFCLVGYFAYHSVEGERGLATYVRLTEQAQAARLQLEELTAERQALERRVALLRSDGLDRDLLDERARLMLNLARPDEFVVLDPAGDPPR